MASWWAPEKHRLRQGLLTQRAVPLLGHNVPGCSQRMLDLCGLDLLACMEGALHTLSLSVSEQQCTKAI